MCKKKKERKCLAMDRQKKIKENCKIDGKEEKENCKKDGKEEKENCKKEEKNEVGKNN